MTTEFKVEQGVPMPNKLRYNFPFEKMTPGDSFFIPCKTTSDMVNWSQAALRAAREKQIGVTTRRLKDGVRVWVTSKKLVKPPRKGKK